MAEHLDSINIVMPSLTTKGMALVVKTEVPGVWMIAASRAGGGYIPTEHGAFMKFLQQVSEVRVQMLRLRAHDGSNCRT